MPTPSPLDTLKAQYPDLFNVYGKDAGGRPMDDGEGHLIVVGQRTPTDAEFLQAVLALPVLPGQLSYAASQFRVFIAATMPAAPPAPPAPPVVPPAPPAPAPPTP